LPKAVAVTIQQIDQEPLKRVFLVPGNGKVTVSPSSANKGGSGAGNQSQRGNG